MYQRSGKRRPEPVRSSVDPGIGAVQLTFLSMFGADRLLSPAVLHTAAQVCASPSPVPAVAGVYAWYFDGFLPGVPANGCKLAPGAALLYVGISPKAPPVNGTPSRPTVRHRVAG